MKKNILSIFILSTTLLSTQANAYDYAERGLGTIDISGQIMPHLKCDLQPIAAVHLPQVKVDNFADSTHLANVEPQQINIDFTNCADNLKNIKLIFKNKGKSTLDNIAQNGSNVSIAILNKDKDVVDLSQENSDKFKINIDEDDQTASYIFFANYKKPEDTRATAGHVVASLSFDVIYSDIVSGG